MVYPMQGLLMGMSLRDDVFMNALTVLVCIALLPCAFVFLAGVHIGWVKEKKAQAQLREPNMLRMLGGVWFVPPKELEASDILWLQAQWSLLHDVEGKPLTQVVWPEAAAPRRARSSG